MTIYEQKNCHPYHKKSYFPKYIDVPKIKLIREQALVEKMEKGHEQHLRNLKAPKSHEMMFNVIYNRRSTN